MKPVARETPDLHVLVDIFYSAIADLGEFEEVDEDDLPEPYRGLLDHDEHMTVTVERFHHSPVDVRVLQTHFTPSHYSRKILLSRHSDGRVVQYGIVRLNFSFLGDDVRHEIESQQTPLGRILIEHNVLRKVKLLSLWRIDPGVELGKLFELDRPQTCYGRTALIYCNSVPAVELLEIVPPV